MDRQALGLIETLGMIPAIEAADTCVKSANVRFLGYERSTGGLVTIKVEGDVGAVKSAIDAGKASAQRVGTVISTLVIPRPAQGIDYMINPSSNVDNNVSKEDNSQDNNEIKNQVEENKEKDKEEKIKDNKKEEIKEEVKEEVEEVKEEVKEEVNKETKEEKIKEEEIKEEISKKKSDICNLCYDPKCTRKKGQPKTLCIHYKNK